MSNTRSNKRTAAQPNDTANAPESQSDEVIPGTDERNNAAAPASSNQLRKRPLNKPTGDSDGRKRARNDHSQRQPEADAEDDSQQQRASLTQMRPASLEFDMSMRSGKVLTVVLTNFMCHKRLAIDFNSQVNLLLGENGSGKSAILTALMIGLGCKASATHRGSSVQKLIKRGENSAKVEIHLANHLHDGYQPNVYGERIIVERTIFAAGHSSYKVKSAHKTLVTSKRDELQRMLTYLNVQVDNPVCVLNQDVARSFLRDGDPKKFYQLYIKSTHIEAITNSLNECAHQARESKIELGAMAKTAERLRKDVDGMRERVQMLLSVGSMQAQMKKWRQEREWKLVIAQEQLLSVMQVECADFEKRYAELVRTYSDSAVQNGCRDRIRDIETSLRDSQTALAELRQRVAPKRSALDAILTKTEAIKHSTRTLEVRLQRHRKDVQQLRDDIAERMSIGADGTSKSQAQVDREKNEQQIVELTGQLDETVAMLENARRDEEMLANTRQQELEQQRETNDERQALRGKCETMQRELDGYQKAGNNVLAIYGPQMPRLVREIEAAFGRKEFQAMPIGPIGRYIEIVDDKWKCAVEYAVGSVVSAFLVCCAADRKQLDELIAKHTPEFRRLSLITMSFDRPPYDLQGKAVLPCAGSQTILDVIRVGHPVVMQCLLDHCSIERVLMVDTMATASQLCKDRARVPANLNRVLLLQPFTLVYPAPHYRSYSLNPNDARYLQLNVAEKCAELKGELRRLVEQHAAMDAKKTEHETRLRDIVAKMRDVDRRRNDLELTRRKMTEKVKELQQNEFPEEDDEYWNNELQTLEKTVADTEENLRIKHEQMTKNTAEASELTAELDRIKAGITKQTQQIAVTQKTLGEAKWNLNNAHARAQSGKAQCESMAGELQQMRDQLQEAQSKLDRLAARALKQGERIETQLTDDELQRRLSKHEHRIAMLESAGDPLPVMQERLTESERQLKLLDDRVRLYTETLVSLRSARNIRFSNLVNFKQTVAMRVQHRFNSLMKLRKFKGTIKIDNESHTVTMSIIPRDAHIDGAVSNSKSLSGGERSFSTIALLLSLWTCVNVPFYFLDEYDVFTDTVNRHYINQLLLGEAQMKRSRQYTFLTPQDMSDIRASADLTIHSLAAPER